MATQIGTGTTIPALALTPSLQPWRNTVWIMPDGWRLIVFTDGTNLKYSVASNGQTGTLWSAPVTLVAGITAMTPLITTALAGSTLYVFQATAGGVVNCWKLPYTGAGAFGAVVSVPNIIANLTGSPQSIRAVYDPLATTVDIQHTVGTTGIVHLMVDSGTIWYVYALDVHTAGTNPKIVLYSSIQPAIAGPTYATNMVLRTTGALFALSPGANAWTGYGITYVSGSTSTTQTQTGPTAWLDIKNTGQVFNTTGGIITVNLAYEYVPAGGNSPLVDNNATTQTAGTFGNLNPVNLGGGQVASPAGMTYPTGLWTFNAGLMTVGGGLGAVVQLRARLFELTVSGQKIYRGATLWGANTTVPGASSLIASGSITGWTMGASSSLYWELDFRVIQAPTGSGSFSIAANVNVTTPQPTSTTTTTTTTNTYTFGALETPTLPLNANGAAMIATYSTTAPAIDMFVYRADLSQIATQQRYATGGYSTVLNLGGSALINSGLAAAGSSATTDEVVYGFGTFAAVTQVGSIRRTAGVWGAWAQETLAPITNVQDFCATAPNSLGVVGQALVYTDTGTPVKAWYDDLGFVVGAVAPGPPTGLTVLPSVVGALDAVGTITPFNVTTLLPRFQITYNDVTAGNAMSAVRYLVNRTDIGPSVVWDSGQVGVIGGPLPGGTYTVVYGAIGTAATALVPGGVYTVQAYAWDTATGQVSVSSAIVTMNVYAAPVVASIAPTGTITAFSQIFTFDYQQQQAIGLGAYDVQVLDSNSLVVLDTGTVNIATLPVTTMAAVNAVGTTAVSVVNSIPGGFIIVFDSGVNREAALTVGAATGTGPYGLTLDRNLNIAHAIGSLVGIEDYPSLTVYPGLANNATYTTKITGYGAVPSGHMIIGQGTNTFTTGFPAPPAVTGLIAQPNPGKNPLTGGTITVSFYQPPGAGAIPNAATWNLYQRNTGVTAWTLVANQPADVGIETLDFYSVPNSGVNPTPIDIAVAPVSADGVEGLKTVQLAVSLTFRLGMWLNDTSNPASCCELGRMPANASFPEWAATQGRDTAFMFNRPLPVATLDTTYALVSGAAMVFILDSGYEAAQLALLRSWDQFGTPLQIRDIKGRIFTGWIKALSDSSEVRADYQKVTLSIDQIDPGVSTLLLGP